LQPNINEKCTSTINILVANKTTKHTLSDDNQLNSKEKHKLKAEQIIYIYLYYCLGANKRFNLSPITIKPVIQKSNVNDTWMLVTGDLRRCKCDPKSTRQAAVRVNGHSPLTKSEILNEPMCKMVSGGAKV
jgi:hypothetical protein